MKGRLPLIVTVHNPSDFNFKQLQPDSRCAGFGVLAQAELSGREA